MPTTAPRTLAEQLRAWPDERLTALLELRPDLGQPAPQDSAQLASRIGTRSSVVRAVDQLTLLELAVLDAVVLHGGTMDADRLRSVLHADAASVDEAVTALLDGGLLWGTHESLRGLSVLPDVVGTALSGLGDLPRGTSLDDALAERDGTTTTKAVDVVPPLATTDRGTRLVDSSAAGAAYEVVRHVEHLLERWGIEAPGVLRSGGLGVRDHRATARDLQVEEGVAALVVELAAGADLLAAGVDAEHEPVWLPTDAYDAWRSLPPAEQWSRLAAAWLDSPRLRGALGRDRKPHNVLEPGSERGWLVDTRRGVLGELAGLEPGTALDPSTGPDSLLERMRWLRPRRPPGRTAAVAVVLEDAAALGLTGLGGLSVHGRALLDQGGSAAAAALAPLLPDPVDHVLLQADLTAVAPGPLEHDLAQRIASVADVESRGAATTYRFTASSVRRAFDVGWSASEVHDLLGTRSRTPVPQALTYLVDDVARRFGTVRVGVASAFLRSDDETALAALVHDSRAASLRLRLIAPTVLVTDVAVSVLLPRLRELGLAPVVEAADGSVRLARPDALRSRAPRRRGGAAPALQGAARRTAHVAAVVRAVRAGDRAAALRPRTLEGSRLAPSDVMSALREATETAETVWIEYVDGDGRTRELVVEPRRVEAGTLVAHDHRSDGLREFSLHRISGVRAVPV